VAKIKNVSGEHLTTAAHGLVQAGQVVDVPDADVIGYTLQGLSWEQARAGETGANWKVADKAAEKAHDAALAANLTPEGD
jgi:hypothetical protein